MRMILPGLAALLLAACSGNTATNNSIDNAAAPAANDVAPATPAPGGNESTGNGSAGAGGESRADMLAECSAGAPGNVPEGTDIAALCGCAVDKVIAGERQRDAVRQCANEQGVVLPERN